MRTRHVVVPLATLAAGVVSPTAWALSCDDVIQLVEHGVPETVIVEQVKSAGESYSADEVSCLEDRGAPEGVVGQAKRQMSAAAPAEIAAAVSAGSSAAADLTEEAVYDSLPKRAVGRTPEYRATKAAAAALCAAVLKAADAYQCAKDAHSKGRESSERTAASECLEPVRGLLASVDSAWLDRVYADLPASLQATRWHAERKFVTGAFAALRPIQQIIDVCRVSDRFLLPIAGRKDKQFDPAMVPRLWMKSVFSAGLYPQGEKPNNLIARWAGWPGANQPETFSEKVCSVDKLDSRYFPRRIAASWLPDKAVERLKRGDGAWTDAELVAFQNMVEMNYAVSALHSIDQYMRGYVAGILDSELIPSKERDTLRTSAARWAAMLAPHADRCAESFAVSIRQKQAKQLDQMWKSVAETCKGTDPKVSPARRLEACDAATPAWVDKTRSLAKSLDYSLTAALLDSFLDELEDRKSELTEAIAADEADRATARAEAEKRRREEEAKRARAAAAYASANERCKRLANSAYTARFVLGWKDCLSKADFTPTAIRYATTDDDLYEQYIEKTTVRCISSVGVAAKFQAFANGCRVEGAVDFHSTNDANGEMPSDCYESKTGDICLYEWLEGRYPRREDLLESPQGYLRRIRSR